MRWPPLLLTLAILLSVAPTESAHRLDEYLLDTTFSIHRDRVEAEMRLTSGVSVAPAVLTDIDTDGDGSVSEQEKLAHAMRVVRDLSLSLDGKPLQPRLVSATYPALEDMREGVGEILLRLDAELPRDGGSSRTLNFENHHRCEIAAYMVNALVPADPDLLMQSQSRNHDQSTYRLVYTQGGVQRAPANSASWSTVRLWLTMDAVAFLSLLAAFWRRRRVRDQGCGR